MTITSPGPFNPSRLARLTCWFGVGMLVVLAGFANAQPGHPLAETTHGKLLGTLSERAPAVSVFKGIPYAAPPVGQARWQPPATAESWTGERMADTFGPDCMQQPYPEGSFFYRPARLTSEDCLYLNVWTAAEPEEARPVMVWLHGGALTRGSGAIDTYDGSSLAQKDVVVVTINYRLGVFGYFAHPELVAESAEFSAGNYGILDQIQALEWVQENIAAFGGDPDNVTVFGESAGAWSVHFLTASPLAEGLFDKAIAQSGARLDPRVELDRQGSAGMSATAAGTQLAGRLGAGSLSDLRAMPARDLLDGAAEQGFRSDGIVDGWVIPEQPYQMFSQGRQNKVPVLVGFNSDEGTTLGAASTLPDSAEAYEARIRSVYGDFADMILDVYPADDIRKSTLDNYRDGAFGWNMVTWANLTRNVDESAYLYFFTHRPPGPMAQELGAYHAAEIAYVFNNVHTLRNQASAMDYRLADIMSDYWVNFAHHGVPSAPGQPQWLPYSNAERHYLLLGTQVSAEQNLLPDNWAIFDRVMDRRR
ncbi:carboxylesterase/lipase family protein [Pseudohongiella sp.]|uniref:Carboxylesterase type B domain-containing protein n=1 Tax=marine sediment metagenome TaxID=412755 RepID=A0A0F9W3Y6_9ZZZZ|nr:carboxylesterase family protein [Pseudohongiella sp.]HDZ10146.1 carboxylesterase family protein [Pseudohongiella sp.]HEA64323.1 carboxylesterase family protein [Pseudohongiella sp.]